jgi:hypothetical protein
MRAFIKLAAAAIAVGMLAATPAATAQDAPQFDIQRDQVQPGYTPGPAVYDAESYPAARLVSAPAASPIGDGEAEVAWGFWLWTLIGVWGAVIATFVSTAVVRAIGSKLEASDAERLRSFTENAINMGLNAVANATRDKKLKFKTGSEVVEWALEYANQNFPQLVEQFGGREAQRLRTWARIDLEEGEAIPPISPRVPAQPAPADPAP